MHNEDQNMPQTLNEMLSCLQKKQKERCFFTPKHITTDGDDIHQIDICLHQVLKEVQRI